jgi:hypothetical protein
MKSGPDGSHGIQRLPAGFRGNGGRGSISEKHRLTDVSTPLPPDRVAVVTNSQ